MAIIDLEKIDYDDEFDVKIVIEYLIKIMNEKGIKKQHVAKKCGDSPATLTNFLKRRSGYVSKDRINKYLEYLNTVQS